MNRASETCGTPGKRISNLEGCAYGSVVEHLAGMYEALAQSPVLGKEKKKSDLEIRSIEIKFEDQKE